MPISGLMGSSVAEAESRGLARLDIERVWRGRDGRQTLRRYRNGQVPPGRRALLLLLVAFTALFAGTAAAWARQHQPLVIAVESPQSGEQSANGLDELRGAELAVRDINAHGGLLGRKVKIYKADDRGEAGTASQVASNVIAKHVKFVIGPYNSSVGLANLPIYRSHGVLPVWMTSKDATAGLGVTVQPMNSQIAPIEASYILKTGAQSVAMLVDETVNGGYTSAIAREIAAKLQAAGRTVVKIPVEEVTGTAGNPPPAAGYYAAKVAEALAGKPQMVYVSTYFPEGVAIAKALAAASPSPQCLMGLGNVDNAFLERTTAGEAQRCRYAGVVAAEQMPSAKSYVKRYVRTFKKRPSVWGSFYYDSANVLFAAIERAHTTRTGTVERVLRQTKGFKGATGAITIDPKTGYRRTVPVNILVANPDNRGYFELAK